MRGRRWIPTFLGLCLCLCLCLVEVEGLQELEREPQDNEPTLGETITLPCQVRDRKGAVQWTRDGFGLGFPRDLPSFRRYSMVGNEADGVFDLKIENVTLEDDAVFQCQVGRGPGPGGDPELMSREATVTVRVSPKEPRIVQGRELDTTAGTNVTLICEAQDGKPPPQVYWANSLNEELASESVEMGSHHNKLKTTRSTLHFTVGRRHHNATFECYAQNSATTPTPLKTSIRLKVKYPPDAKLTASRQVVSEGDPLSFFCKGEANPPDLLYIWSMDGKVVDLESQYNTTSLHFPRVDRSMNGSSISCEVSSVIGKSKATLPINIRYGPRIRDLKRLVSGEPRASLTLSCQVDSNPPADIYWTRDNHLGMARRRVSEGGNYTIRSLTLEETGDYTCFASMPGFHEVSETVKVLLRGPPEIKSERTQFGRGDDTVTLECKTVSVPHPSRVQWDFLGKTIVTGEGQYVIKETRTEDGLISRLIINDARATDFGTYNCSVRNAYGTVVATITLQKQRSVPLLIILAGVIGGIIMLIAIVMIFFLCQRRSKSPEDYGNSSEKTSSKPITVTTLRSSNELGNGGTGSDDSDMKLEIQTASGSSLSHREEDWERGGTPSHSNYRYSADYIEPTFPPKPDTGGGGQRENGGCVGYVPYVDYARDYNPSSTAVFPVLPSNGLNNVDPRYSATYGNPYLRTSSSTSLPPPHLGSPVYVRNGSVGVPNGVTGQYITASSSHLKPGTLATHV